MSDPRSSAYSHADGAALQLDELAQRRRDEDASLTDEQAVAYLQRAQRALTLGLDALGAGAESWGGMPNRETYGVHEHLSTRFAKATADMVQRTASETFPAGADAEIQQRVVADALRAWVTTTMTPHQAEMVAQLGALGRVDWLALAARWWAPQEGEA